MLPQVQRRLVPSEIGRFHKTELSSYLLSLARESSLNAFFGVTYLADFNSAKS
jgi:hypothetical protein